MSISSYQDQRAVKNWLLVVIFMVFLMVLVGGATRLTDSGLSMVDWRPLMGAIPPLSSESWQEVFERYQQFPEYQQINKGMSLDEFKSIFFWEYFHRLLGRMVGVVFFFPYLYFLIRKKITKEQARRYSLAFILGGIQGGLGWYMVKSGLVDRPDVSQLRLAMHLLLALFIIGHLYWQLLMLKLPKIYKEQALAPSKYSSILPILIILVIQIMYGAFVAGLDAGLVSNTFPLMNGNFFPVKVLDLVPWWHNLYENSYTVHFIHRWLGILLWLYVHLFYFTQARLAQDPCFQRAYKFFMLFLWIQVGLGILTVMSSMTLLIALAHQVNVTLCFIFAVRSYYFQKYSSVLTGLAD